MRTTRPTRQGSIWQGGALGTTRPTNLAGRLIPKPPHVLSTLLYLCQRRRKLAVLRSVFAHKAVVRVFWEPAANALRRHVDPHKVVVPDYARKRQHRSRIKLGRPSALYLRVEALPRAVPAKKPRVERGIAPLGEQHGATRKRADF